MKEPRLNLGSFNTPVNINVKNPQFLEKLTYYSMFCHHYTPWGYSTQHAALPIRAIQADASLELEPIFKGECQLLTSSSSSCYNAGQPNAGHRLGHQQQHHSATAKLLEERPLYRVLLIIKQNPWYSCPNRCPAPIIDYPLPATNSSLTLVMISGSVKRSTAVIAMTLAPSRSA